MNSIHEIWGLDHKCINCGRRYLEHTEELKCIHTPFFREYKPKGPQVPTKMRLLLQGFEDAAIAVFAAQWNHVPGDTGPDVQNEYKRARFALMRVLQELYQQAGLAPPTEE